MGCTLSKAFPESGDGKPKSHRRRRQEKQASRKQNSYHAPPAVTAVSTATSNRAQVAPRFPGAGKRLDSGPSKVYSSNSGGRIYAPGDPNHPSRRPVSKAFRQKYAHHYNPAIEMPQRIIVSRVSLQFLNLTRGVVRLKGYPLWTRFGVSSSCHHICGTCYGSTQDLIKEMARIISLAKSLSVVYTLSAEC